MEHPTKVPCRKCHGQGWVTKAWVGEKQAGIGNVVCPECHGELWVTEEPAKVATEEQFRQVGERCVTGNNPWVEKIVDRPAGQVDGVSPRLDWEGWNKLEPHVAVAVSDLWTELRQVGSRLQGVSDRVSRLEAGPGPSEELQVVNGKLAQAFEESKRKLWAAEGARDKFARDSAAWIRAFGRLQAAAAPQLVVDVDHPEEFAEAAAKVAKATRDELEEYRLRLEQERKGRLYAEEQLEEVRAKLAQATEKLILDRCSARHHPTLMAGVEIRCQRVNGHRGDHEGVGPSTYIGRQTEVWRWP